MNPPEAPKPTKEEMNFLEMHEKRINETICFALDFLTDNLSSNNIDKVVSFATKTYFPVAKLLTVTEIQKLRTIQDKLRQLAYKQDNFKPQKF